MSIQSDVTRISQAKTDIMNALNAKKSSLVSSSDLISDYATRISSATALVDTSAATATADKILEGYSAYVNGSLISGTASTSGGNYASGSTNITNGTTISFSLSFEPTFIVLKHVYSFSGGGGCEVSNGSGGFCFMTGAYVYGIFSYSKTGTTVTLTVSSDASIQSGTLKNMPIRWIAY